MTQNTNETSPIAQSFASLGLSPQLLRALADMEFTTPTPIQAQAIPPVLAGRDIIGRSHTGTGKTMAFGIPTTELCLQNSKTRATKVLILCPTRELAMQAADELRRLLRYTQDIRCVCVYGGQPITNQIPQLRRGAEIVIGTPGRVMDHIHRHTLHLDTVKMVVLDEADEMLNMGFREDIESILTFVTQPHQTLLFSATMPQEILNITHQYQNDPVLVETESGTERTIDTVEQYYYEIPLGRKKDALGLLLHTHKPRLAIIFCNTKKMVEELGLYLNEHGFQSAMLHGDMKQDARTAVMRTFKSGRTPLLIATDVAARGIDVDDVDAVYNFDIPQDYEYYIHRIGRTGRAGRSGVSHTLAAGRRQAAQVRDISRFVGAPIEHKPLPCTNDIMEQKQQELLAEIRSRLSGPLSGACNPLVAQLTKEGISPELLAEALLELLVTREMSDVPVLTQPKPGSKQSSLPQPPEGYVRLRFSVGKYQRVAPNHIVAAITQQTRIPGKQIEKIYSYREYSLVDVPNKYKNVIIQKVSGTKIGGHSADVRLYDLNKGPASHAKRDSCRQSHTRRSVHNEPPKTDRSKRYASRKPLTRRRGRR